MGRIYTVITEYRGGTYVSQVEAETPSGAVQRWSETKSAAKGDVPAAARSAVREQLCAGDAPVPVSNQENVWCISGTHRNELILINVVLTWTQS